MPGPGLPGSNPSEQRLQDASVLPGGNSREGTARPSPAAMRAVRASMGSAEFKYLLDFPVMILFRFRS
jgi:hypothetical protein